jgi:hypothetical protein
VQYPVVVRGEVSADGGPLSLYRPDSIVVEAEALLPRGAQVADLGAHHGTTGLFLAAHGHHVDSIEINEAYIEDGRKIERVLGGVALGNRFIHGDMRTWVPQRSYDAAMAIRSLQLVSKEESYEVVDKMQRAISPGGLNVIKAYIADLAQQRQKPNRALFEEDELQELYSRNGWQIVSYETTGILPLSQWSDTEGNSGLSIHSHASLIARETHRVSIRQTLLAQADYYRQADPEHAEVLRAQAESI